MAKLKVNSIVYATEGRKGRINFYMANCGFSSRETDKQESYHKIEII